MCSLLQCVKLTVSNEQLYESIFKRTRSLSAIKSEWEVLRRVFGKLIEFYNFTGGNGDADEIDGDAEPDASRIQAKLDRMTRRGIDMDSVNATTVHQWETNGWYDLWVTGYALCSAPGHFRNQRLTMIQIWRKTGPSERKGAPLGPSQ